VTADDLTQEAQLKVLYAATLYERVESRSATFLTLCLRRHLRQLVRRNLSRVIDVKGDGIARAHARFLKQKGRAAANKQELVDTGFLRARNRDQISTAERVVTGASGDERGDGLNLGLENVPSQEADPGVIAERNEGVARIVGAMNVVAERDPRAGCVLRARLGVAPDGTLNGEYQTFEDIAEALGVKKQGAHHIYLRGLRLLREAMGERTAD